MSTHRPDAEQEAPPEPERGRDEPDETPAAARIAELEAEVAACRDRLLRALAAQENSRRRAEREREEAVKFAASGLARNLLSTLDNLRRAIESVPQDRPADETVQRLVAGVVATERALLEALEKHGVRRIDALGQPFDPNLHEAVFQAVDVDQPAGTVTEVLQPGYLHHDRLLRPAMVGVAKGGEEAQPEGTEKSPPSARGT